MSISECALQKQPADAQRKKTDAPQPDVKEEEEEEEEEKDEKEDNKEEKAEEQADQQSEYSSWFTYPSTVPVTIIPPASVLGWSCLSLL